MVRKITESLTESDLEFIDSYVNERGETEDTYIIGAYYVYHEYTEDSEINRVRVQKTSQYAVDIYEKIGFRHKKTEALLINWGAWGSVGVAETKEFINALNDAVNVVEILEKKFLT